MDPDWPTSAESKEPYLSKINSWGKRLQRAAACDRHDDKLIDDIEYNLPFPTIHAQEERG